MNSRGVSIKIMSLRNEQGAALVIAVMILLILTVIGIYAVTTSTLETKITGFHKWHVEAFYAADAGIDYAMAQCTFGTVTTGSPYTHSESASDHPKFDVSVTYRGETLPPVGSATGTRSGFMAHHYLIHSEGEDEHDIAEATVDMWGYRIGF